MRSPVAARRRGRGDQAEVAGAAAEVADEHELVVIEAALVLVGRGDRLVGERDVGEAGASRRRGVRRASAAGVALRIDLAGGRRRRSAPAGR